MNICVFGASSDELDQIYFEEAEKLGCILAENGYGLVFGGGKHGLMGAAARGVHDAGGKIIGIAPYFFDKPGILFEHCTEFIITESMRERKRQMESLSDAFVVLPGGIGTYEEFFEVLTLKQLSRHRKPIVLYNINGYFAPLLRLLDDTVAQGFMFEKCKELYQVCDTPEECIALISAGESPEIDLWKLKNIGESKDEGK